MKKSFLFLVFFISFYGNVVAQFSNSTLLFYVRSSSSNGTTWNIEDPENIVHIYKFMNGNLWEYAYQPIKEVSDNLKRNNNFYEEGKSTNYMNSASANIHSNCFFNKELSNSKWYVYCMKWDYCPNGWTAHTEYFAFKTDYSEYMHWYEPGQERLGKDRITFKRLTKNELKALRFTSARSFLQ